MAPRSARADSDAPFRPYSIPWQLRPALVASSLRLDTSIGRYEDAASRHGTSIVSFLAAQYKIPGTGRAGEGLGVGVRGAIATDAAPDGISGTMLSNPFAGVSYTARIVPGWHANFTAGATVPVGGGGGNTPSVGVTDARAKAIATRMAMDSSLFSVNDLAGIFGFGIAYTGSGLTLQAEATLFQYNRTRGAAVQPEASKTSLTSGIHVGYFFAPWFSLGGELRHQRWLNAPFSVDTTPGAIDQSSFAVGPRFHVDLGHVAWLRPGIAYSRGLDHPLAAAAPNYHVIQIDIPVVFQ